MVVGIVDDHRGPNTRGPCCIGIHTKPSALRREAVRRRGPYRGGSRPFTCIHEWRSVNAGRPRTGPATPRVGCLSQLGKSFPTKLSSAPSYAFALFRAPGSLRRFPASRTLFLAATGHCNELSSIGWRQGNQMPEDAGTAVEAELAQSRRELSEALARHAATSEVLHVISASRTDAQPVFEMIVRRAVALCGSLFANVFRFDGELLHFVAGHNVGPSYVELLRAKYPMRPDSSQVSGRVLLTKSVVHLEDVLADPDYDQRFPQAMGWRRMLGVPMVRDGTPLGVIVVGWAEAGPTSKVQEELLKTFADQAVIAIENVRLFDAEQRRTRELSEALEQQTATSEVLGVISSSPGELEPVFHAILENATRLCDAKLATFC